MFDPNNLFRPITSTPGESSEQYVEVVPCDVLRPYIRCFWGTPRPYINAAPLRETHVPRVVIPDACMDIIFTVDYLSNEINGQFCGINDAPFVAVNKEAIESVFGIRFHSWAVHLFVDNGLQNVCNTHTDIDVYFPGLKNSLKDGLFHYPCITDRIPHVEQYLMSRLGNRFQGNNTVLEAVYYILKKSGVVSISELLGHVDVHQRQLERVFSEYIGVPPKKMADLVRYQNVWRDVFYGRTGASHDIVYDYGYYDQAHLLHDFKRYHGMTPLEALEYASA